MQQNDHGQIEHKPRTLVLDITTRLGREREEDRNVVAVVRRNGDLRQPIVGLIRNKGVNNLVLSLEQSSDKGLADPFLGPKGSVTFAGQPTDGENVIIDDDVNAAVTFEFDSNNSVVETATLRKVVIGANSRETMQNLLDAINAAPALNVQAVDVTPLSYRQATSAGVATPTPVIELTNTGAGGNVAVTTTANPEVVVAGMTGVTTAINFRSGGANVTSLTVVPGGVAVFIIEAVTEEYLRFKATPPSDGGERHGDITLTYFFGKLEEGDPAFGRIGL